MINDDESILRKENNELYTNHDAIIPDKRSFLHDKKIITPDFWQNMVPPSQVPASSKLRTGSPFKKIFFGSLGFLIVALVFAGLSFIRGTNSISSNNVVVSLTTRSFIDGGESFPLAITLANRNRAALELATLTLEYPEGNAENPSAVKRITRDIGSIGSGETKQESFELTLFGEEGSGRTVNATLEFRVVGSNVIYTSKGSTDVVIRSSPVRLVADIPKSVIPNQEIPLKFTITGNGTTVLSDTAFVIKYPAGFTFARATPMPTLDQNVWFLGDLPAGADRTITVFGTLSGGASELKTIQASVGIQDTRNERLLSTVYNTISEIIPLTNAFLDVRTEVAGKTDTTIPISATSQASLTIHFTNTLSSSITNAQLSVKLSGSAYDPTRVQAGSGYFDSNTNTITWTKQQNQTLASIAPGEGGQVSFSLSPGSAITGANPAIDIVISAIGFDASGSKLTADHVDVKKLIISSDLNLLARTLHYSGPIQNTGTMPPRVGNETTYTIDWQITNSRNRITGVTVKTTLPVGVSWKNVIVPQTEQGNFSYNEVTHEVMWNVGEVGTGSGGISTKSASFKVSITPSASQVTSIPELTDDIIISGHDEFTKNDVTFTKRSLTTQLLNDTSSVGANGQVEP